MLKNLSNLSKSEIQNAVKAEYEKVQAEHAKQFSIQIIAAILYTKFINTNISTAKLKQEYQDLQATFELMENGFMGLNFNVEDCIAWVKDTLKIDLDEELKTEVKNK